MTKSREEKEHDKKVNIGIIKWMVEWSILL